MLKLVETTLVVLTYISRNVDVDVFALDEFGNLLGPAAHSRSKQPHMRHLLLGISLQTAL